MSNAMLKEVPPPVRIDAAGVWDSHTPQTRTDLDLTEAKVVAIREFTEEDYLPHWCRRDGGLFLILELNTGERHEVFCPYLM